MEGDTHYDVLSLRELILDDSFVDDSTASSPAQSIFNLDLDADEGDPNFPTTTAITSTITSDETTAPTTMARLSEENEMMMQKAMKDAAEKVAYFKKDPIIPRPKMILDGAQDTESWDEEFKEAIGRAQEFMADLSLMITSCHANGVLPGEHVTAATALLESVRSFFVALRTEFNEECRICHVVNDALPPVSPEVEDSHLFNLLKSWSEEIVHGTSACSVAEHSILASFATIFDGSVYKPYLHLTKTNPQLDKFVSTTIPYLNHLIGETLAKYTELVGYKMYWKVQMTSLIDRMNASPSLLCERKKLKRLFESLQEAANETRATAKRRVEMGAPPGARCLSSFQRAIVLHEEAKRTRGPMGMVQVEVSPDQGYRREDFEAKEHEG